MDVVTRLKYVQRILALNLFKSYASKKAKDVSYMAGQALPSSSLAFPIMNLLIQ